MASVVTSDELEGPVEHGTVASERSVGVLVVTVEVSGDDDMSLNMYSTPVPRASLNDLPIVSPRENSTLLISLPLKKFISQSRVVNSVTVQVKVASDSEQTSNLRIGMSVIL